jgi:hypothetical protein
MECRASRTWAHRARWLVSGMVSSTGGEEKRRKSELLTRIGVGYMEERQQKRNLREREKKKKRRRKSAASCHPARRLPTACLPPARTWSLRSSHALRRSLSHSNRPSNFSSASSSAYSNLQTISLFKRGQLSDHRAARKTSRPQLTASTRSTPNGSGKAYLAQKPLITTSNPFPGGLLARFLPAATGAVSMI